MQQHTFTAQLIRNPLKPKSDDWQETAHHWLVTINGASFDYYTGLGHREALKGYAGKDYKGLASKNLTPSGLVTLLKCSKPKPPSIDEVLYALCSDASACDEPFDEWCDNLGYNTDSRKALETYLQCQENATKLRKAGVHIGTERERLEAAGY